MLETPSPTVSILNGVLVYNANVVLTEDKNYQFKGAQAIRIPLSQIRQIQHDSENGVAIVDGSGRVCHIYQLVSPTAFIKRVCAEIDKETATAAAAAAAKGIFMAAATAYMQR